MVAVLGSKIKMRCNRKFRLKARFRCLTVGAVVLLFTLALYFSSSPGNGKGATRGNASLRINQVWSSRGQGERLQTIPGCGSERRFFYGPPRSHTERLNSTCSDEGSHYARGQNVLSFSLKDPGDTRTIQLHKEGIALNLERMKEFYPGSSMRIYTDIDLEAGSDYCELLCSNPELHWCDVRTTPSLRDQSDMFLMTWRFLPLGDPPVDTFLSRDLDSAIIQRQVGAVQEWLFNSSKAFHLMRDNLFGHDTPILGGLWGGSNSRVGMEKGEALREKIIKLAKLPSNKSKWRDQSILNSVIFFRNAKNIVAFDSYNCEKWRKFTEVRPFPFQRKDKHFDFAGNRDLGRKKCNIDKCPVECRPEYGKDWEYC